MKKLYLFLVIIQLICVLSCTKKNKIDVNFIDIKVVLNDEKILSNDFFELNKIIVLSNEVALGGIQKIEINDSTIFILDNTPKIVCFDFYGKFKYSLDSKGKAPDEFLAIDDFAIKNSKNQIVVLDYKKRRITYHDIRSGTYLGERKTDLLACNITYVDNSVYYFKRYTTNDVQAYSLTMENDNSITRWFPHTDINKRFYSYSKFHFFKSNDSCYVINRYDNKVYKLTEKNIQLRYVINVDNFVDSQFIKDNMNPKLFDAIEESGLVYNLNNFYVCDDMAYFTLSKGRFSYKTLYDLQNSKILFSTSKIGTKGDRSLPVFASKFDGVYNNLFYALLETSNIVQLKEILGDKRSFILPEELIDVKISDNPVIMFYKFRNGEIEK
jgi:hypothetical protein